MQPAAQPSHPRLLFACLALAARRGAAWSAVWDAPLAARLVAALAVPDPAFGRLGMVAASPAVPSAPAVGVLGRAAELSPATRLLPACFLLTVFFFANRLPAAFLAVNFPSPSL